MKFLLKLSFLLPAETAKNIGLFLIKQGFFGSFKHNFPALKIKLWGLEFKSPMGLAAGFDKDGYAISSLYRLGFSHIEAGTITPLAQSGNPKPRIFRFPQRRAIINRMGFPNNGFSNFSKNIEALSDIIYGVSIGANRDNSDMISDYVKGVSEFCGRCAYIALNISSPNTEGLRSLDIERLLNEVRSSRLKSGKDTPLLVKISPDLEDKELENLLSILKSADGLIIGNTTVNKGFREMQGIKGGLSGAPLRDKNLSLLAKIYHMSEGELPLIGVGGIFNAEDAYAYLQAGASMIQIYSSFAYYGKQVIFDINNGLDKLLKRRGFDNISALIGSDNEKYRHI